MGAPPENLALSESIYYYAKIAEETDFKNDLTKVLKYSGAIIFTLGKFDTEMTWKA